MKDGRKQKDLVDLYTIHSPSRCSLEGSDKPFDCEVRRREKKLHCPQRKHLLLLDQLARADVGAEGEAEVKEEEPASSRLEC